MPALVAFHQSAAAPSPPCLSYPRSSLPLSSVQSTYWPAAADRSCPASLSPELAGHQLQHRARPQHCVSVAGAARRSAQSSSICVLAARRSAQSSSSICVLAARRSAQSWISVSVLAVQCGAQCRAALICWISPPSPAAPRTAVTGQHRALQHFVIKQHTCALFANEGCHVLNDLADENVLYSQTSLVYLLEKYFLSFIILLNKGWKKINSTILWLNQCPAPFRYRCGCDKGYGNTEQIW